MIGMISEMILLKSEPDNLVLHKLGTPKNLLVRNEFLGLFSGQNFLGRKLRLTIHNRDDPCDLNTVYDSQIMSHGSPMETLALLFKNSFSC